MKWHSLELTVGQEVLVNHKPNDTPSRLTMRRATGRLNYSRAVDPKSPEFRMFVKEQRRLISVQKRGTLLDDIWAEVVTNNPNMQEGV